LCPRNFVAARLTAHINTRGDQGISCRLLSIRMFEASRLLNDCARFYDTNPTRQRGRRADAISSPPSLARRVSVERSVFRRIVHGHLAWLMCKGDRVPQIIYPLGKESRKEGIYPISLASGKW